MCQPRLFVGILVAEFQAVGLERLEIRHGRHFEPAFLRFGIYLEIISQRRGEGHVAAAESEDAVGQLQCLDDAFDVGHHAVQRLVTLFGKAQLYDLHLVELVQTVQSAHILAVRPGFAAETGGVGGHLHRKILLVENHVAVDVRHGHFGRRNEVEVVRRGVVHLSLLVGQLSRAEAGGFIDHDRRLHFQIPGPRVAVEEEVDERTLQPGALSLINGEPRAGELYAQVEVDDVVFAGQLPVGQRVFGQLRIAFDQFHNQIVFRRFAFGHDVGREVRQGDDRGLKSIRNLFEFGIQRVRPLLEGRDFRFFGFGFVAPSLTHQCTDLFGRLVLCGHKTDKDKTKRT